MKKFVLLILLLFLLTGSVMAEPKKWKDDGCNFKDIANALIIEPVCEDNLVDEDGLEQIQEMFLAGAKMKKVKFFHVQDIVDLMADDTKEVYNSMLMSDADAAQELVLQEAQKHCDVAVYTTVTTYHSSIKHVPASTMPYTVYKEKKISLPNGGKQIVRHPETRHKTIPAHDVEMVTVETDFRVLDLKTSKDVLKDNNRRNRALGRNEKMGALSNMFKKSVEGFFSDFYKLVK